MRSEQCTRVASARREDFAAATGSTLFDTPTRRIWQRNACSSGSAVAKIWLAIGFQCSATHSGSHAPGGAFDGTIRNCVRLSSI